MTKLHYLRGFDDGQFHSEFCHLIKVSHKNVVRLIGYCHKSRKEYRDHNGETVFANKMERLLCFEYIHGGSVDKHIAGMYIQNKRFSSFICLTDTPFLSFQLQMNLVVLIGPHVTKSLKGHVRA